MAWEDKPTDAQLSAIFNITKWVLPRNLGKAATDWLEATSDRKNVSNEIQRLKGLDKSRRLDCREIVFDSEIWEGFNYKEFSNEK